MSLGRVAPPKSMSDSKRAVGALLVGGAARRERVLDAERAPRAAAVPVAAEELERGHVRVALDRAEHVGLGAGAAEGRADGVDLRLGVGGAAGGRDEGHGQARAGGGVGHGEALGRAAVHGPLRGRAGRAGAGEVAGAVVGEVVALGPVEQVDAEGRRLHRERADGGRDRGPARGRAQRVAPVHERVAGLGLGRGGQAAGHGARGRAAEAHDEQRRHDGRHRGQAAGSQLSLTRRARFAARRHLAPILISSVAIAQKPGALCTPGGLGRQLPVRGHGLSACQRRGQVALDGGSDAGDHLLVGQRGEGLEAQDVAAEPNAHELGPDQRRAPLGLGVFEGH